MMWKKVNSFLLRLRYLKLLAEIYIRIAFIEFRRELDFRRQNLNPPKGEHIFHHPTG